MLHTFTNYGSSSRMPKLWVRLSILVGLITIALFVSLGFATGWHKIDTFGAWCMAASAITVVAIWCWWGVDAKPVVHKPDIHVVLSDEEVMVDKYGAVVENKVEPIVEKWEPIEIPSHFPPDGPNICDATSCVPAAVATLQDAHMELDRRAEERTSAATKAKRARKRATRKPGRKIKPVVG